MNAKNWEVGSTWFANPDQDLKTSTDLSEHPDNVVFLSSCRSAISAVIDKVGANGVAFVPAFTCHSVVEPFVKKGYKVYAYPVNKDLTIDWSGLNAMVSEYKPDIILIHSYFGLNNTADSNKYLPALRNSGVTIIDDQTQTMFSAFEHIDADYSVGSIRKWLEIADGAFVSNVALQDISEDKEYSDTMQKALALKGNYIYKGEGRKEDFMPLFSQARQILDSRNKAYKMSEYSKAVLSTVDWKNFKKIRRDNYNYLADRLAKHPEIKVITQKAADDEVPFMLPVYIEQNRSEFQSYMAKHNVYPTIIWTRPENLTDNYQAKSDYIYNNILCFYIDQRYDLTDMQRVADIVDSYFDQRYE